MTATAADNNPAIMPLEEIERVDGEGDEETDEKVKRRNEVEKSFWTRLAQGSAIASGILAVLAMVLSSVKSATVVAGLIAIGVAGLVIYQQELLQDTDSELSISWH